MDNDSLISTYRMPINLQHEEALWKGGFCLSRANFDELHARIDLFLHPKEKKFLANLTHAKRQESYLLGRYCAKQAIATYLLTPRVNNNDMLSNILIEGGVFQQPIVYHDSCNNIQVSISHTDKLGAALVFPEAHPMAIDVETICAENLTAIKEEITATELKFASLFSHSEIKFLTLLWTAKEALSKVLKCGFTIPLDLLEINEIIPQREFTFIYFKNFFQYQAISFEINNAICSIVYPKKTKIDLDVLQIQQKFV